MLIGLLIVVLIIGIAISGATGMNLALVLGIVLVPAFLLTIFLRNSFADGFTWFLTGGGAPATSAATLQTDLAEGYLQQQEYDAALYAFQDALRKAKGAQRGPIMLRLAETAQIAEHWDEALRWWREALALKKGLSADQRASAMFHMAEVVHGHYRDTPGAVRLLARIREEYGGTEYATYAEERLRALVEQRAGGRRRA